MALNRLKRYEPYIDIDNLYYHPNNVVSHHRTPSVVSDISIDTKNNINTSASPIPATP